MITYNDYFKLAKQHQIGGDVQYEVITGLEKPNLNLGNAMTPRPSEIGSALYDNNQLIIELRLDEDNASTLPLHLRGGMSVDIVSLINHNLNNQAIIEIKTYGYQETSPNHHETFYIESNLGAHIKDHQNNSFLKLSQRQERIYRVQVEIHFLDNANSDPALTLGRLWVGKAIRFQPNTGFDGQWDIGYVDNGVVAQSVGGDVFSYEHSRKRELSIPLRLVRREQAIGGTDTLQEMLIQTGKTGEIIVLPESGPISNQFVNIYGMLVNEPVLSHHAGLFAADLKVRQLV